MRRFLIVLWAMSVTTPTLAQHEGHGGTEEDLSRPPQTSTDPHAGHNANDPPQDRQEPADPHASHDVSGRQGPPDDMREGPPPPAAFSEPAHAADILFDPQEMAEARELLRAEHGASKTYLILVDRFETRVGNGEENYLWDLQGWYGGDIHKLWLKSEGEGSLGNDQESAEVQALYSRAISPFFDLQAGVRYDVRPEPDRTHLVLGLQGLLPYVFEIDAAIFLSEKGDLSARLEGEYDLQINQRLILQPRVELNLAAEDVPELGIGSGLSSVEAGLRLRYEMRREIAPYVGIGWGRKLGDTGDFAHAAGEERGGWEAIVGLRSWF
jgi:copper resistance protein B